MQWVSSVTADATRSGQRAHRLIPVLGRRLIFALLTALMLSVSGCAWVDAKQRNILYRPTPGEPADFAGLRAGDERYFLNVPSSAAAAKAPIYNAHNAQLSEDTAAQQIEMWWLPHTNPTAPTLLYYHGTFRNLVRNLPKINALREAGFAILAVDYRGWGRSTVIVPSEQTIMQDAQIAFEELKRREPRASHRVLYGHSMGSGVAVEMASRLRTPSDYSGLILESAMTNFPDVAVQASWLGYLVRILSNERFASIDKIADIKAPLLMIHGTRDATIPYALGQKLFAAANQPKVFLTIEGGNHSNLQDIGKEDYQKALTEFRHQVVLNK